MQPQWVVTKNVWLQQNNVITLACTVLLFAMVVYHWTTPLAWIVQSNWTKARFLSSIWWIGTSPNLLSNRSRFKEGLCWNPFYLFSAPLKFGAPLKQRHKGKTKRDVCKNTTKSFVKDLRQKPTRTWLRERHSKAAPRKGVAPFAVKTTLLHHPVAPNLANFPLVFGCIRLFY
jgi:hypothetical protein